MTHRGRAVSYGGRVAKSVKCHFVLLAFFILACDRPAWGANPAGLTDLTVDLVSIKGGTRLLGSVLGRESDGSVAIAVGRGWLKKTHQHFYDKALRDETSETRAAIVELRGRISTWRTARSGEKDLDFFLSRESERIENILKAIDAGTHDEVAPFMIVDIVPSKIERIFNQPLQRRKVALAAWREGLADVETRSMVNLMQELKKRKIELVDDADALLELLPPRKQNDVEWAARQALVEYRYLQSLDFQATGDVVVRTGAGAKAADVGQLLGEVFKSLGGDLLSDLLDPPVGRATSRGVDNNAVEKFVESAARVAESETLNGFRVSRVIPDLTANRATVETRFVARLPDGAWKTIWQQITSADAAKARPDVEQQIENDPQLRDALKLIKSLGGGEDSIKRAIRFGAATMDALKEADSRFFEFRDRFLVRLDGPILRVSPTAPPRSVRK